MTHISRQPPVADFSMSPHTGPAPLKVTFTDLSTGPEPIRWRFDFGDGEVLTSRRSTFTHVYKKPGRCYPSLVVSNPYGGDYVVGRSFYIEPPLEQEVEILEPQFVASPMSGDVPLKVTFTDVSVGNPVSWSWDFGDGSSSMSQHPTHTYTQQGTYYPTLTVSDGYGSNRIRSDTPIVVGYPFASASYSKYIKPAALIGAGALGYIIYRSLRSA